MADGNFATLVSKDTSLNSSTNPISTRLTDGTDEILITAAGELNVLAGANSGVDIGDVTINNASGGAAVNIQDGGNVISIDDAGGSLTVDGTVAVSAVTPGTGATDLGKAVDDAGGATDTGVALLALRDDVLTTLTPVDGDYVRLRVNSTGALHVTSTTLDNSAIAVDDSAFTVATDSVSVSGYLADETTPDSVDEGDIGAARMTLDRRQIIVLSDSTTESQRLAIDSSGNAQTEVNNASGASAVNIQDGGNSITVDQATHGNLQANVTLQINDVDVSATVPVPVSATAAANTKLNPIFVENVTGSVSASEVHDFDEAVAVAGAATDNHDYTVVNTTFLLKQVDFSASGAMKVEIQTGPVASLVTVMIGFIPKRGGQDTWDTHHTPREVPVTSTGTVRVIRTNREGSSQDLHSTIIGNDV